MKSLQRIWNFFLNLFKPTPAEEPIMVDFTKFVFCAGRRVHTYAVVKAINSMTNWQNHQWMRAGHKASEAVKFSEMKRRPSQQ